MRTQLFWMIALSCLGGAAVAGDVTPSIVKIYTTYQKPSWSRPWQMSRASSMSGSGCVLDGNRILTNAHVVSDQTFIQVRRAGSSDKFVAEVEAVSHELDLALLRVEDKAFFKGAAPLSIGELPRIGDRVVAYGFPRGGTRVTITRGVVSRIDRQSYSHSRHENLVCQIDAAINSGSSGGPVLDEKNRIAGVAFQVSGGQSIGYMIPVPVLKHFLKDLGDGRLEGSPLLPITWQYLENRSLRDYLGLASGQSGVLVQRLFPGATGFQDRDVIVSLDGEDVGNDGTITLRTGERIALAYAADRKQLREHIPVVVLRAGELKNLDIELDVAKQTFPYLVPRRLYGKRPSYYVFGGFVFSPLTSNYFGAWDKWADVPFALKRYWYMPRKKENAWRKQVVNCIAVLPDRLNTGYPWAEDSVVAKVNGKRIGSMRDLIAAFESHKGPYHRILFEPDNREVALARDKAAEFGPKILARYGVPADRSKDLR